MKQYSSKCFKSQEFARLTGVTKRTLRHYDEIGLLRPQYKNEAEHRFYSEEDFEKMQRILALKFIGLPLCDIKEMQDQNLELKTALHFQQESMQKKVTELQSIIKAMHQIEVTLDSGEFIQKPGDLDTYKLRELSNGEKYEIIKNYYEAGSLRDIFEPYAEELHIVTGSCFWWLWYQVK